MSDSPKGIPYVPEGTLDPAAGLNDAIKVIDVLVQPIVTSATNTPPGSPDPGQAHIVTATATGAWTGKETQIAYFTGDVWQFLEPKTGWMVFLVSAGAFYRFTEGSPGTWSAWSQPTAAVVTESGTSRAATPSNTGEYVRHTNASAKTCTWNSTTYTYAKSSEHHGRNVGAGDLTLVGAGGMTLNPPAGGTLVIPQGGTYTVKIVSDAGDEADVIGVSVPA